MEKQKEKESSVKQLVITLIVVVYAVFVFLNIGIGDSHQAWKAQVKLDDIYHSKYNESNVNVDSIMIKDARKYNSYEAYVSMRDSIERANPNPIMTKQEREMLYVKAPKYWYSYFYDLRFTNRSTVKYKDVYDCVMDRWDETYPERERARLAAEEKERKERERKRKSIDEMHDNWQCK